MTIMKFQYFRILLFLYFWLLLSSDVSRFFFWNNKKRKLVEEQSVDLMFTLILVTVVIVNNSLVNIKKVRNIINCSSSSTFQLMSPSPVIFQPPPLISQSNQFLISLIIFLTNDLLSLGNTSHYGSDLAFMLTEAGVCCLYSVKDSLPWMALSAG